MLCVECSIAGCTPASPGLGPCVHQSEHAAASGSGTQDRRSELGRRFAGAALPAPGAHCPGIRRAGQRSEGPAALLGQADCCLGLEDPELDQQAIQYQNADNRGQSLERGSETCRV